MSSRVVYERSPYIYPSSKIAAPQSNSSGLEKSIEVCPADVSGGGWVLLIVLCDKVWCLDVRGYFPRVVFSAKALPLDQELEPPLVPATIQYLFHFPLWFSINDDGWQQGLQLSSWYRVLQSG